MEQKLKEVASRLPEATLCFEDIAARPAIARKCDKPRIWKTVAAVAACLVVLFTIGFGSYAYAVEVKEYNAAVRFFNEHGLCTENLSRREIKAVYRDITTESFAYSKTAEVIKNSLSSQQVGGYEIWQDAPTPEDVENLWNYKQYGGFFTGSKKTSAYSYRSEYGGVEGELEYLGSYVEKHDGEILLWSTRVPGFRIRGLSEVSDGVIVYGNNNISSSYEVVYAWIAKLDADGNLLWTDLLNNGSDREYVSEVLECDDGTYAVFSRCDSKDFCLSQYAANGKRMFTKETDIGRGSIQNVVCYGDGYLVQLSHYMESDNARIVKVDREGNITDSFHYSGDDCNYYIQDMIEFNGKIILSAYATPKLSENEISYGGREEIARILDYVFKQKNWEVSDEELTRVVRANYTAVLLICDPDSGVPHEFYSVAGSLGAGLVVNEAGKLIWDVESITSTVFSPYTSAYTIYGRSCVFRYTFNDAGLLISQERTDEIGEYMR